MCPLERTSYEIEERLTVLAHVETELPPQDYVREVSGSTWGIGLGLVKVDLFVCPGCDDLLLVRTITWR
jgi:hypothetical protein